MTRNLTVLLYLLFWLVSCQFTLAPARESSEWYDKVKQEVLDPLPPLKSPPTFRKIQKHIFGLCMYCHIGQPPNFHRYESVVRRVVKGKPESSKLFYKVATGRMPPGGARLQPEQLLMIHDWIKAGAKDN